jgi:hypothetical protein
MAKRTFTDGASTPRAPSAAVWVMSMAWTVPGESLGSSSNASRSG